MKKLLYFLSIIIMVYSCNRDSITYEESTFVSDPEEIKWPFVYGEIVSESGEKMTEVEVDVYQNDSLMGKVFSDSQGRYSTHTIKTKSFAPITIKYQKKDFSNKYRRFEFENSHYSIKNIVIGQKSENSNITKEEYNIENPSDTNLIKIYGYAKLKDGTPVSGVLCEVIWSYTKYSDVLFINKHSDDHTDEDGYFELLVPKRKIIHFQAFKRRYPDQFLAPCFEYFSDENPIGAISQWNFMEIGKFENNYNLKLREDIEFLKLNGNVKGRVLSCGGTPIYKAKLRLALYCKNGFHHTVDNWEDYFFDSDGYFSIYFETCPYDNTTLNDYKIKLFVEDTISKFSGEKEIAYSELADMGAINLCFDDNVYPGEFNLNLDSEIRVFPEAYDNPKTGKDKLQISFYYSEGVYSDALFLSSDQVNIGEVAVKRFKYWKGKVNNNDGIIEVYETTFDAKPEDVTMTITKIENDYVYGSIVGEVDTPKGRKSVNATFRVYNK